MTWQIFLWAVALILFVLAGILAFRPWPHHWALACLGLAAFVAGFLHPAAWPPS